MPNSTTISNKGGSAPGPVTGIEMVTAPGKTVLVPASQATMPAIIPVTLPVSPLPSGNGDEAGPIGLQGKAGLDIERDARAGHLITDRAGN